jgi:hypothetical protein
MVTPRFPLLCFAFALAACNVESVDPGGDGGVGGAPAGECPRALVVSNSDFSSTNISLVSTAGKVLTESVVSSASAPPGVTTALSGDVVSPTETPPSGHMVLIDRFPNAVLTFLDPATGKVLHQLSAATGFSSNPHDYLEVSDTKAYVSRFESNPAPGTEAFDAGGDLLIVDTKGHTITGSIPLASKDDGELLPRPDRLAKIGDEAWVVLGRLDASFTKGGDARVVGIDTTKDTRTFTLDLKGMTNCGGLAVSPSRKVVALSCSGVLGASPPALDTSGVVLIDATQSPPKEITRFQVATQRGAPVGSSIAFASEDLLVGIVYGDFQAMSNDAAFTLDTKSGALGDLFTAGAPFVLGEVRCAPGCGDICVVADADANALRWFSLKNGAFEEQASVKPNPSIGLPPRGLGLVR